MSVSTVPLSFYTQCYMSHMREKRGSGFTLLSLACRRHSLSLFFSPGIEILSHPLNISCVSLAADADLATMCTSLLQPKIRFLFSLPMLLLMLQDA